MYDQQIISNNQQPMPPCVLAVVQKLFHLGWGAGTGCVTPYHYIAHATLVVGRWANVWLQFELCAHNIDFTARPVS